MDDPIWKTGRPLGEVSVQPLYHFEYRILHDQRLALVRRVDLWHQIGLPASFVAFGFLFQLGIVRSDATLLITAAAASSFIILLVMGYARRLDNRAVTLYPRIITLELMLDFFFYREYIKSQGKTEQAFVERCEALTAGSTVDLYNRVKSEFDVKDFPLKNRHLLRLYLMSFLLICAFVLIAGLELSSL